MPIPKPEKKEDRQKFVARCMGNETMKKEYPDNQQRIAICLGQTKTKSGQLLDTVLSVLGFTYSAECCGDDNEGETLSSTNIMVPTPSDYVDCGDEDYEEFDLTNLACASEYQGRKVTLNKPFRTPDGPKKFSVYVKNDKGNVVKVNFGDPNMKIKKNIPERRRSFRARHNCDNPGPKWKARYWSCKAW